MVDELILRDVKNILSKIEVVKTRDDYEELISQFEVPKEASEEEINEAIVTHMMSEKEIELYKRYLLYKKKTDITNLIGAIDTVSQITTTILSFYDLRSRNNHIISYIEEIQKKIVDTLRDIPRGRVGTEYNKVKNSYKKYYDEFIQSGKNRYNFVEKIEQLEHSSIIVRSLKKNKLKKLQQNLDEFNVDAKKKTDTLYLAHINEREAYGAYLRNLMTELLSKDNNLYNAGLLALHSMYNIEVPIITLESGIKVIDVSAEIDITPEEISAKAFEYFQKIDEPEFDADMFIKSFKEFLLHFYRLELQRLNNDNDKAFRDIKKSFLHQKHIVQELSSYQESIEIPGLEQEKDEEDTYALVYKDTRYNK